MDARDILNNLAQRFGHSAEWVDRNAMQANMVCQFRRYYKGDHPTRLTSAMKDILHQRGPDYKFGVNYMQLVIDTAADRLNVSNILVNDDPALQKWNDAMFSANKFAKLQSKVHLIALRDGNVFLMPDIDPMSNRIRLHLNYAFDGSMGIIPIYVRDELIAAYKITANDGEFHSCIAYTPNTITHLRGHKEGYVEDYPMDIHGLDRLPIIHFANRRLDEEEHGESEIASALGLQDALNHAVINTMSSGSLAGAPVGVYKNTGEVNPSGTTGKLDTNIPPGTILEFYSTNPDLLRQLGFHYAMPPEFADNMNVITDLTWHIMSVTNTPLAVGSLANISGETIKQLENKLLAKVNNMQTTFGDNWVELAELTILLHNANNSQAIIGNADPSQNVYTINWKDAQVRNDDQKIAAAEKICNLVALYGNQKAALELFLQMTRDITGVSPVQIQELTDIGSNPPTEPPKPTSSNPESETEPA